MEMLSSFVVSCPHTVQSAAIKRCGGVGMSIVSSGSSKHKDRRVDVGMAVSVIAHLDPTGSARAHINRVAAQRSYQASYCIISSI